MADFGRFKLAYNDAKEIVAAYDNLNDSEFADQVRHWANYDVADDKYDPFYKEVRSALVQCFQTALTDNNGRIDYILDLKMGIRLFELMSPTNGFTIIQANDDDVWRYVSVNVMPDITFIRYPNQTGDVDVIREYIPNLSYAIGIKTEKDSVHIKKKRFYSHTRRIWLKTLWWYVYLGWQGNFEKTYSVLQNNGTNIISHFIERPGRGYRPALFRYMLYAYSLLPEQKDSIFRAAAKMNLAKCVTTEPALTIGGELQYSKALFEEVLEKEQDNQNVE